MFGNFSMIFLQKPFAENNETEAVSNETKHDNLDEDTYILPPALIIFITLQIKTMQQDMMVSFCRTVLKRIELTKPKDIDDFF